MNAREKRALIIRDMAILQKLNCLPFDIREQLDEHYNKELEACEIIIRYGEATI